MKLIILTQVIIGMTSKYRSGYERCDEQEGTDATNSRRTSRNSKNEYSLRDSASNPTPF